MSTALQGECDERFGQVAQTLQDSLDSGADVGASVAVMVDGELVVDLWGGTDGDGTTPWQRDTVTNVFSTTKTMTFLTALVLADRGELDLDAPVQRYWPQFANHDVLVRHFLGHTSGYCGWTELLTPEELADWDRCTSLLAAQQPWWPPGASGGYHAITQGYLIGELVRCITGQTIGTFFAEQIARPLGADFHIGTPEEVDPRVFTLIPPPPIHPSDTGIPEIGVRTLTNPAVTGKLSAETWWRRAEIPAANGHGNARSVAAVQHVVACSGETPSGHLLSGRTVDRIFEQQSSGTDLVLGVPLTYGMGYGLQSETLPLPARACYWGGYGGSLVVNDLDARMTVAFVMNRMEGGLIGDPRGGRLVLAAYQGLTGG